MVFEQQFKDFIHQESLKREEESVLLAVSGGLDSMVMTHLFQTTSLKLGIAHVNHALRGEESDEDERFVQAFAAKHEIPFFSTRIPGTFWSGKNLQQDARNFRYQYLNSIAKLHGYTKIATAHHMNDQIETFFLHLARGSGLEGLTGIQARQKNIIRPLLFASRNKIIEYATKNEIDFREDSSNAKSLYQRNFVRHNIIPLIEQLPPGNLSGLFHSLENLKKDHLLLQDLLDNWKHQFVKKEGEKIRWQIKDLVGIYPPENMLFHLLATSGFNASQCEEMLKTHTEPKQWFSHSHQVWVASDMMTLEPLKKDADDRREIVFHSLSEQILFCDDTIKFFLEDKPFINIDWVLDQEKLRFPLTLRNWRSSDVFRPRSMKGKRKEISKIISENRIEIDQRKEVRVLVNGDEEIIAVLPGILSFTFVKKYDGLKYVQLLQNENSLLYN